MPLRIPDTLPAVELLKAENIYVLPNSNEVFGNMNPLRIVILNLMPLKITTETDFIRLLSNNPLQVEVSFMKLRSHTPKHTSAEHMQAFYRDFDLMREERFDGMIITGAPVEQFDFEDVWYWPELLEIFSWAKTHVTSTLYICWAAFAGMYYHYGIRKYDEPKKVFGVFPHRILKPQLPLFRGFDDEFYMPHSRHTGCRKAEVELCPELQILAESDDAGVCIMMARNGREIYITGHSEYSPYTLDTEYKRDLGKGLPIQMPLHYYKDDDMEKGPLVRWRAHANLLFSNWINYYVCPETPYNINQTR